MAIDFRVPGYPTPTGDQKHDQEMKAEYDRQVARWEAAIADIANGVPLVTSHIERLFPFTFTPPRTLEQKRYDAEAAFWEAFAAGQ